MVINAVHCSLRILLRTLRSLNRPIDPALNGTNGRSDYWIIPGFVVVAMWPCGHVAMPADPLKPLSLVRNRIRSVALPPPFAIRSSFAALSYLNFEVVICCISHHFCCFVLDPLKTNRLQFLIPKAEFFMFKQVKSDCWKNPSSQPSLAKQNVVSSFHYDAHFR